ncbi:MAG TPA: HAD hydrolase-like protein [Vicinamibacterales bacterium]|nr:HAD hydrolase-like protein [Vicinamibacterales bacterium]
MTVSGGIALVVFDMAGTTVEVGDGIPIAFAETMAAAGVSVTAEQIAGVRGASKREAIRDLLRTHVPERLSEAERIYETFRVKLDEAAREFKPAPGIENAFETLRARGFRIALNTGFDRDLTDTIVHALSWSTLADVVVTGDDVERGRPAPDLIRRAMALTGIDDPKRVASVGDTSLDLQAGANAGAGLNIGVWSGAHSKARLLLAPHTHLVEFAHEVVGIV